MFKVTGKGFHMTFANGYTVSVQWNSGNYSDGEKTAEVAVWDKNGKWAKLGSNDDVVGWQTPEEVAKIIAKYARKKS